MSERDTITLISGNRSPRGIVERDRFSRGNVFYRAAIRQGYSVGLYRDVVGPRGGLRTDVLTVWTSQATAERLDQVSKLAKAYPSFLLISLVDQGFASQIAQYIDRPAKLYSKDPEIPNIVYDPRFLEQCYVRAYDRFNPVYRNNLGYLSEPETHESKFLELERRHIKPVVPKVLQRCMAEVIEDITTRHPQLAPSFTQSSS